MNAGAIGLAFVAGAALATLTAPVGVSGAVFLLPVQLDVLGVPSPQVTPTQGQAALEDGGAGLILQVRAEAGQFKRDDRVVLVDYLAAQNAYRVIQDGPARAGSA